MAQEIAFEQLLAALETTRGTAIDPATHLLHVEGKVTPNKTTHKAKDQRGTLRSHYRNVVTRKGSTWEWGGDADVNILPFLLNAAVAANSTFTTPATATLSRLITFTPSLTADNLKSLTLYYGDPGIQVYQVDYGMCDELTLENNAADEEGVLKFSMKGKAGFPTAVSDPTPPASIAGVLLPGQMMQLWIDTSSAIGTTAITGRLVSVQHTFPTGVTYKHLAAGPTSSLDYSATGREQPLATTKLVLELNDTTQYANWASHDTLKVRVRHNGANIETTFYNYVEVDMYGPFTMLDWGENQGSNRTIELTVEAMVDSTLGADYSIKVQSVRTAL